MADLHVDFLGKRLAGPVVAASGTFGFGPEYADTEDLRRFSFYSCLQFYRYLRQLSRSIASK